MQHRLWIVSAAAAAALCLVCAAAVLTQTAAGRAETPASPAALPAAASAPTDAGTEDRTVYLVRDYSGEICVFQGGALIERTGIPVSTLPQSDRALAEVGIAVTGRAALSELLGDLGS